MAKQGENNMRFQHDWLQKNIKLALEYDPVFQRLVSNRELSADATVSAKDIQDEVERSAHGVAERMIQHLWHNRKMIEGVEELPW